MSACSLGWKYSPLSGRLMNLKRTSSPPTPLFTKKYESLTHRISLSQTGLLSMASNSGILLFLPGFNDLSLLNYAPSVTVIFSDLDRWMEFRRSLFGVLTESELIFCLAWLILGRQQLLFHLLCFSSPSLPKLK